MAFLWCSRDKSWWWREIAIIISGVAIGPVLVGFRGLLWKPCLYVRLVWLAMRGRRLRISFAYLIRVRVDDKYLLVRNERSGKYQPPGGVFQFRDPSIPARFDLGPDTALPNVPASDLRLIFKSPFSNFRLFDFLCWFKLRQQREVDAHREFEEELIATGILPAAHFSPSRTKMTVYGEHYQGIRKSRKLNMYDYVYFEFWDLNPDSYQIDALTKALQHAPRSRDHIWVTAAQIERDGGVHPEVPLADHSMHLL